ncbi:MAG: flagellar basal body L-ring protein FlgH [Acidobacteria bacterium]|nr:flagellar basal body L-ring protein FlgH [Acidobacteriota bacterium]
MKSKAFSLFLIVVLGLSAALAQDNSDKKDKKKKNKSVPQLTVVQVEEKPPVIPVPPPQKPSNGSLFTDNASNSNLLRDFKARQVGDLVFVDIVEETTATVTSTATRSRDSGNLGGLVPLVGAIPGTGAAAAATVLPELGKRKFEGKGTTDRTSSVKARIAARVVEVLPNGDLRIEAIKQVRINKETEQLAVTGIVRANDLAADNSIETIYIGDLRVEMNGKGIASADNAPGWLFRLFDKLSPF